MRRIILVLALTPPMAVNAAMVWTSTEGGSLSGHAGHGARAAHGRPAQQTMTLKDGEGAAAQVWLPTLEHRSLEIDQGTAVLKPSGLESYHLLYAERDSDGVHETALRYHYLNGKPSGHSPAELIYAEKTPLEIIPAPLAREHARYLSDTNAAFMLRYHGKALADQPITLETSNGTRIDGISDARGRVSFTLPDDFPSIANGRDNNPPADFFVYTRYSDDGIEYRTSLSASYYINPLHWQSRSGALWSGVAGFITGIGILGFVSFRKSTKGENA